VAKRVSFGVQQLPRGIRESFQVRVRQIGLGQQRRKTPGVGDLVRLQPALDCFLAIEAFEFILKCVGFSSRRISSSRLSSSVHSSEPMADSLLANRSRG